jgi:hypothetical protein
MTLLPFGRPSYRWFTIALIVALASYGWYVVVEYDRLNELNQRQLSNTATDLKATLETAMETVRQFDATPETSHQSSPSPLCDFDKNQPYLEVTACTNGESPLWNYGAKIQAVATQALGIANTDTLFQVRADTLFKELASVDAFELIFVANKDGEVLAQDAPAGRQWIRYLRWAEQTSPGAKVDRSSAIRVQNVQEVIGSKDVWDRLRTVTSRTSVQLGGSAHELYLQPVGVGIPEWDNLVVGAVVPTSAIMRDALAVDADLLALLLFLVLIGLFGFPFVKLAVINRHERFGMRDVTRLYLSTGALLVLLTCGSFALDGYRRWHAEADLGLQQWASYLDASLTSELRDIRQYLVDYDALLKNKLSGADKGCGTVVPRWFLERPEMTARSGLLSWPPRPPGSIWLRQVGWIRSDGQQQWKATADSIAGLIPHLSQRPYVMAVQNNQLFQIAQKDAVTSSSDDRPFFFGPDRSITDGKLYTFVSIKSTAPETTCRDAKHSDTKRSDTDPRPKALQLPSIVSTSGLLLSLDRQPMPAGYGFALVNREGSVLYHSDRRLSLRENLFDELSQSDRVRAMIYAGESNYVTTRYRERAHQFYFRQLDRLEPQGEHLPAGFFIATFRDTSVERAIVGHEFVAGLVVPMLVLLTITSIGLGGLSIIARFVGEHRWGVWLWPHGGLDRVYKQQAIGFGVLLLLTLIICATSHAIVAAVLSPLVAAALGITIYVNGQKTAKDRSRLTAVGSHAAALLLLIVCLFVVPSAVLFRLSLHHEFEKLIQTENAWIDAQRADAPRDTEDDIPRGNYGDNLRCAHRSARRSLYSLRAVPSPFGLPPETSTPGEGPTIRLAADREGSEGSETIDPATGACRQSAAAPEARATSGVSQGDNDGRERRLGEFERELIEHLDLIDGMLPMENDIASRTHFQKAESIYSPAGTLVSRVSLSGITVIALGPTLALLVWWIRWNTNRLFFADYEVSPLPSAVSEPFDEVLNQRTPEEQILLLQIARERIANPGQRPAVERLLDLGLLRLCPDLRPWPRKFEEFLLKKEKERHAEVAVSEHVTDEHSWQSVRLILALGVAGLGFFLVATQPGLQSMLLGLASGVTTALTSGLKLRDAIVSWLPGRKASAG